MSAKFRRCFYESAKVVFNNRSKSPKAGPRQWLIIALFLYSLKMFAIVAVIYRDYDTAFNFRRHEMMLAFVSHYRSAFDYSTLLMMYLFNYAFFALEYCTFRLDTTNRTWRFWWLVTVGTVDDAQRCTFAVEKRRQLQLLKEAKYAQKLGKFQRLLENCSSSLLLCIQNVLVRTLAKLEVAYNFEHVDHRKLMTKGSPAPLMPRLSWNVRKRVLRIILITEFLAFWGQALTVLIFWSAVAVFAYLYPNWNEPSWLAMVQMFSEVIGAFYILLCLVRYFFFFGAQTFLGTVIFTGHVLEERRLLSLKLSHHRGKKRLPSVVALLPIFRFLKEHNLVCYQVLSGSQQLWSRLIFGVLLTQAPINIVFLRRLFSERTPNSLRFLFAIFILVQLAIYGIIFVPLSWCYSVYHSPAKLFPRMLMQMSSNLLFFGGRRRQFWLLGKLKYDDLYGRLMRGPRIAVFIGPLHAITYLSSLEVCTRHFSFLFLFAVLF